MAESSETESVSSFQIEPSSEEKAKRFYALYLFNSNNKNRLVIFISFYLYFVFIIRIHILILKLNFIYGPISSNLSLFWGFWLRHATPLPSPGTTLDLMSIKTVSHVLQPHMDWPYVKKCFFIVPILFRVIPRKCRQEKWPILVGFWQFTTFPSYPNCSPP